jgi:cell wall-associated NlpC family hydrolase
MCTVAAAAVLAAGLWLGAADGLADPAPSTPVSAAADPWNALEPTPATSPDPAVAALVAQLSTAQAALTAATQAAELAEQKAALAHEQLVNAQADRTELTARTVRARIELDEATDALRQVAVAQYMGGTSSSMSILLSVTDPERLAQSEAVHSQLANAKLTVIAQANDAQREFETLSASAQVAAERAQAADAAAALTQADAIAEQAAAQKQAQKQTDELAAALTQAKLTQQQNLAVQAGLSGGYPSATLTSADSTAYAQQAARAAAQPLAPRSKTWTPAMGQSAATRALTQLLVPYSFGGGSSKGPTLGLNSAGGGEHDASINGFDCSGLALFAWAPYAGLPHDAATQYAVAGKIHPTPDQLQPGDLIFWSGDGTAAGIHHVALYLGSGLVVQAPQSGDVVRITAIGSVSSGLFGATRPLS